MSEISLKGGLKKILQYCDILEDKIKTGKKNLKRLENTSQQILTEEKELKHEIHLDSIKR